MKQLTTNYFLFKLIRTANFYIKNFVNLFLFQTFFSFIQVNEILYEPSVRLHAIEKGSHKVSENSIFHINYITNCVNLVQIQVPNSAYELLLQNNKNAFQ